jgi:hypothetical protein
LSRHGASFPGRRDPEGYYVILARKDALELIPKDLEVIPTGDYLIVRSKSRSRIVAFAKLLRRKGLLLEG